MDERTPWPDAEAKSLGLQIAGKDDAALHPTEGQKAEATTMPDAETIYGPTRPETEVQAVEVQAVAAEAAVAASIAPESLQVDDAEAAAPSDPLPWDIAETATHAAHNDAPPRALVPSDAFGFDELEDGIATIFAALHAGGGAKGETDDSAADDREPADDAVTFLLLGELDRLWHRPDS